MNPQHLPADTPLQVSAVILAWNSGGDIVPCLDALRESEGVELDVIVVDNASSDNSAQLAADHPIKARVIRNQRNLGCAGGNNVGWREARHPHVVFLNPDCLVEAETLACLVKPLEDDPGLGVTGGKLYYPDSKRIQHAGGVLFRNGIGHHQGYGTEDTGSLDLDRDCDYVTGAMLAVRREDLHALGGFDPEYFPAYYEEADLCTRLIQSGLRVRCLDEAVAFHRESVSVGGRQSRGLLRMSTTARIMYLLKNHGSWRMLTKTLPAEIRWILRPHPPGVRGETLRAWVIGVGFAVRCLARFRRRPSGIHDRL